MLAVTLLVNAAWAVDQLSNDQMANAGGLTAIRAHALKTVRASQAMAPKSTEKYL